MYLDEILKSPFTFTKRKSYIPCDIRPLWKVCLIVLILGLTGKEFSASLRKIHTANWITKKDDHLQAFLEWAGKDERKRPDVRLEPAIDRVINLLVANKITTKSQGNIVLTKIGIDLFHEIQEYPIFLDEKKSLLESKKYLTDAAVKRLYEGI